MAEKIRKWLVFKVLCLLARLSGYEDFLKSQGISDLEEYYRKLVFLPRACYPKHDKPLETSRSHTAQSHTHDIGHSSALQ